MKKKDFRKYKPEAQKGLRLRGVKAVLKGHSQQEAADMVGVSRQVVSGWMKLYREYGEEGLSGKKRGRKEGEQTKLRDNQCKKVQEWIKDTTPEQLKFPFAMWTRKSVRCLIERKFGIKLPLRTLGEYLKRWKYTAQRPKKQAMEQKPELIKKWLKQEYPKIVRRAKRQKGEIQWCDQTGIRSNANYSRSYAPKGKTPVVKQSNKRISANVISTITNQGKLRFMLYESKFNSQVFLIFLKRLIKGASKKVFLILDNLRVHPSKEVMAWLKKHKKQIEVYYLSLRARIQSR